MGSERNDVRLLRLAGDIAPLGSVEIDVRPARLTQFTWSNEHQRRQLQSGHDDGCRLIAVQGAKKRAELRVIGATTLEEYKKYVEKDAAFERRFQQVYVGEPSVEDTVSILRGLKDRYERYHGVRIDDAALVHLAKLRNLRRLDLHQTRVGDAGLASLAGLSALEQLDLSQTAVTADGLKKLAAALPRCRIAK